MTSKIIAEERWLENADANDDDQIKQPTTTTTKGEKRKKKNKIQQPKFSSIFNAKLRNAIHAPRMRLSSHRLAGGLHPGAAQQQQQQRRWRRRRASAPAHQRAKRFLGFPATTPLNYVNIKRMIHDHQEGGEGGRGEGVSGEQQAVVEDG